MWQTYFQPTTLSQALELLAHHAGQARLVAGGTDVLVELSRGVRPTATLIDISRLSELKYVRHAGDLICIGGLATHNDVIASSACVRYALPLAQACCEVGAPQIRTRATVAGNLATASPANDTITPLIALGAELVLASASGERGLPLREFYPGFRQTALRPDELVREIRVPALRANQRGLFVKLGLRRAQAISVIDLAIVLTLEPAPSTNRAPAVASATIALGCVAPTIVRAPAAEAYLCGRPLTPEVCAEAGRLAAADARPIDDVRGSAGYRRTTLANLVADGLRRLAAGRERAGWPARPVMLDTTGAAGDPSAGLGVSAKHSPSPAAQPPQGVGANASPLLGTIHTTINGVRYALGGEALTTSLLDALRDDAGLTGTKEGCAEGECGACTVWLNGQAVMACLTPAGQAHGAAVTTIEGLAGAQPAEVGDTATRPPNVGLHRLQHAFIRHAAVQCGYCIPGMLMAGAKLLDECGQPTLEQAQAALSGNICRCTGYRKILDAVLDAAGGQTRDTRHETRR
jgi:carbon-monoxide dehydrogenase medium subunit